MLDVRNRLMGSRKHFRAAVMAMARELAEAGETTENLGPVIADLRARIVDDALQTIRDDIESLGVRQTLARVASDPRTVAAATGWLSIGAASGSGIAKLGALAASAPVAPAIAAGAREVSKRHEVKNELRKRPFWMLHEAAERIRRPR